MDIQHILNAKTNLDLMLEEITGGYLTHKDYPLEERWAVYEKINKLLPIEPWVIKNAIEQAFGDTSLYDEFGIERHRTVRYADLLEGLEDDLGCAEYFNSGDHAPRYNLEQVNLLKEYVLASGVQGFIYDW